VRDGHGVGYAEPKVGWCCVRDLSCDKWFKSDEQGLTRQQAENLPDKWYCRDCVASEAKRAKKAKKKAKQDKKDREREESGGGTRIKLSVGGGTKTKFKFSMGSGS
jgi:rubredoxin